MTAGHRRIGITGGIGSGKSEVTKRIRELGYRVIDADEVAREAVLPGEPSTLRLREEIGDEIFLKNGRLDRQALAKMMFCDTDILMKVNGILHEDIKKRIEAIIGEETVFISIPLLFESDLDWDMDEIWLITADESIRLSRVMERDGLSEEDVKARMRHQMPEEEKRKRADIVIDNNDTFERLYHIIDDLLLLSTENRKKSHDFHVVD